MILRCDHDVMAFRRRPHIVQLSREMCSFSAIFMLWSWLLLSADSFAYQTFAIPCGCRSMMMVMNSKILRQHRRQQQATTYGGINMSLSGQRLSLASSYLVEVAMSGNLDERWFLTRIEDAVQQGSAQSSLPEGAKATLALQSYTPLMGSASERISLICSSIDNDRIICAAAAGNGGGSIDSALVSVLLRVMVQRLERRQVPDGDETARPSSSSWTISFPGENSITLDNVSSEENVRALFAPLLDTSTVELVEMVTQHGEMLGVLPRPLVHSFNLLHRGIGVVVTKDTRAHSPNRHAWYPDLYVHRRTDSKRIFPSLYDMFVGGVSGAHENARTTAAREVAEELGLPRALLTDEALSEPLFDCMICTSYNRCVVTVFCCTFDDSKQDEISWQEEEVAWGSFVPYDVVVESARLCIERMVTSRTWPGMQPYALQQECKGDIDAMIEGYPESGEWDYVPDGLLVWEAWLQWQDKKL